MHRSRCIQLVKKDIDIFHVPVILPGKPDGEPFFIGKLKIGFEETLDAILQDISAGIGGSVCIGIIADFLGACFKMGVVNLIRLQRYGDGIGVTEK
jgi:hypothetical protein